MPKLLVLNRLLHEKTFKEDVSNSDLLCHYRVSGCSGQHIANDPGLCLSVMDTKGVQIINSDSHIFSVIIFLRFAAVVHDYEHLQFLCTTSFVF